MMARLIEILLALAKEEISKEEDET